MEILLNYILRVNLVLAVAAFCYWLCCSRNTYFGGRRFILNVIWAGAFIIPFIEVSPILSLPSSEIVRSYISLSALAMGKVTDSGYHTLVQEVFSAHWTEYVGVVYITIAFLLIVRLCIQLFTICLMFRRSRPMLWKGKIHLRLLDGNDASFSFFRWIFIYEDAVRNGTADDIVIHESAHSSGRHSIDIFLSEVLKAVCWFNPVAWLLTREVRRNLEYLADRQVLESGCNRKEYQMHLLQLTYRIYPAQIYNSFNYSHLKQRIIMMNKEKSKRWMLVAFTIIPTVFLTLIFSGYFALKPGAGGAANAMTLKEGFANYWRYTPTVRYDDQWIDGRNKLTKGSFFLKEIKYYDTFWPNNVIISKIVYLPSVQLVTTYEVSQRTASISALIDGNRKVAYVMHQPGREYTEEQVRQMNNFLMKSIEDSKELKEVIDKKLCYEFICPFMVNVY